MVVIKRFRGQAGEQVSQLLLLLRPENVTSTSNHASHKGLTQLLEDNNLYILVAYDHKQIIGVLVAYTLGICKEDAVKIFLYETKVKSTFGRKAVGVALLHRMKSEAEKEHTTKDKATKFYEVTSANASIYKMFFEYQTNS